MHIAEDQCTRPYLQRTEKKSEIDCHIELNEFKKKSSVMWNSAPTEFSTPSFPFQIITQMCFAQFGYRWQRMRGKMLKSETRLFVPFVALTRNELWMVAFAWFECSRLTLANAVHFLVTMGTARALTRSCTRTSIGTSHITGCKQKKTCNTRVKVARCQTWSLKEFSSTPWRNICLLKDLRLNLLGSAQIESEIGF